MGKQEYYQNLYEFSSFLDLKALCPLVHSALFKKKTKTKKPLRLGVPIVAQHVTNPTSIHEDMGSITGLTQ